MKSNYYLHLMAATTMLCGLSACSDADLGGNGNGETVTFTAKLPMELTRAVGDGTNVKNLTCLVYDKKGNYVTQASASIQNAQANVTLQLASNVDYQLVFWAAAPNSPYTLTNNGMLNADLTHMNANDEANDAFYNKIDFIGGAEKTKTVTLHRPLAQINIGTDDSTLPVVNAAYPSGIYTTLTTDVYTTMDLLSGEVSGRTNITTPVAPISSLEDEKYPVNHTDANKKYKYTNVIYTLVPTQGAVSDMTFTSYASDAEGAPAMQSRPVTAVPMKQNFRTNIYGALLTSTTDFKVTINPNFLFDYNNNQLEVTAKGIESYLANTTGDVEINLTEDLTAETVVIPNATAEAPRHVKIGLNGMLPPSFVGGEYVTVDLYDNGTAAPASAKGVPLRKTRNAVAECNFIAKPNSVFNFYSGTYLAGADGEMFTIEGNGKINIYASHFIGVDPTPYLAEGAYMTKNGNVFEVGNSTWYGGLQEVDIQAGEVKEIHIKTADQLAWLAYWSYSHRTTPILILDNDLDLNHLSWFPLGWPWRGDFDGQNHTIRNLYVERPDVHAGLFNANKGKIRNIILDNATVKGGDDVGGIVGYMYADNFNTKAPIYYVSNCQVLNSTIVALDGKYSSGRVYHGWAGGIAGFMSKGDQLVDCAVRNTTISGTRNLGGLIGYPSPHEGGESTPLLKNCEVENITIVQNLTWGDKSEDAIMFTPENINILKSWAGIFHGFGDYDDDGAPFPIGYFPENLIENCRAIGNNRIEVIE